MLKNYALAPLSLVPPLHEVDDCLARIFVLDVSLHTVVSSNLAEITSFWS